jgi:hypothetical protein
MNTYGYVCFWDRQRIELYADSSYDAQTQAIATFQRGTRKRVRSHQVITVLAEIDGQPVEHNTAAFG